jgi:hypothetical protein
MVIDLIDGTYELFRHFYGLRRFTKDKDRPYGGVTGVLNGVLESAFAAWAERIGAPKLLQRALAAQAKVEKEG